MTEEKQFYKIFLDKVEQEINNLQEFIEDVYILDLDIKEYEDILKNTNLQTIEELIQTKYNKNIILNFIEKKDFDVKEIEDTRKIDYLENNTIYKLQGEVLGITEAGYIDLYYFGKCNSCSKINKFSSETYYKHKKEKIFFRCDYCNGKVEGIKNYYTKYYILVLDVNGEIFKIKLKSYKLFQEGEKIQLYLINKKTEYRDALTKHYVIFDQIFLGFKKIKIENNTKYDKEYSLEEIIKKMFLGFHGNHLLKKYLILGYLCDDNTENERLNVNYLIIGDPGTGKSSLINRYLELYDKKIMLNTLNITGAGLIGTIKDIDGFNIYIPGVLKKYDIIVLDEFQDIQDEELIGKLKEYMENRKISISKRGYEKILKTNNNFVIIGNSKNKNRKFSKDRNILNQILIDESLIERFDFIYFMDNNDDINISKIKQEEIEYYKNKEEIEDIKRYLKNIKKTKITLDQSEILSLERISLEIVTNTSERKLNIPRLFNSLKRFYIAYRKIEQNKDKIIKELYTDISTILSKLNIGYMINLELIEERH